MHDAAKEKTLTRLISIGSALITVFLVSGSVTDPVNAPKLLLLGAIGFGIFAVALQSGFPQFIKLNVPALMLITFFWPP